MKFGVREIANVVFKAKNQQTIGDKIFEKGQPVFYLDTAKTSSMEGAATTVYATGGRGNTRLIAWEGEKTLTFTVEDALLSPVSFAMLSGAGVIKGLETESVHFHQTTNAIAAATAAVTDSNNTLEIDLTDALETTEQICPTAPIYIIKLDDSGDLTGEILKGWAVAGEGKKLQITGVAKADVAKNSGAVMVDYYVIKKSSTVSELQIDAGTFGGYYYVEADTLFRRQSDGKDLPANLTFPNVKIQSNLTFQLSGTGDPSTFTFTMDALPGYTYFDKSREVLCVIQVIEDQTNADKVINPVMPHNTTLEHDDNEIYDSRYIGYGETANTTTQGNPKSESSRTPENPDAAG
jgi:hypothetical protein